MTHDSQDPPAEEDQSPINQSPIYIDTDMTPLNSSAESSPAKPTPTKMLQDAAQAKESQADEVGGAGSDLRDSGGKID